MIHLLKSHNDMESVAMSQPHGEAIGPQGLGGTTQWKHL